MKGCSTILRGGLGNCLFGIANTYAYAKKHGLDYCIPMTVDNPHSTNQRPYIFPGIKYCDNPQDFEFTYNEPHFHYAEIPKHDSILLNGYFQSEKYIEPYKNQILEAFGFNDIETKRDVCSLHFRAQDYLSKPNIHPIISEDYLRRAINYMLFSHYRKFMVFSDDIPAIRKILESFTWLSDVEFKYSEGNDELTDLRLMASCGSNVCANSSFSWWASFINPNPEKTIIMPRKWFGDGVKHNTQDLYLKNAIIL